MENEYHTLSTCKQIIKFAKHYKVNLEFNNINYEYGSSIYFTCSYEDLDLFNEFKEKLKDRIPIGSIIFGFYINGEKIDL